MSEAAADPERTHYRVRLWLAVIAIAACILAYVPLSGVSLSFWFYLMLWVTMASALNIMAGFTGYLPFGYVAFYGIGAYATAISVRMLGLPVWIGFVAAGVAGVLLSLLFAKTLVLRGIYFAIVSLALAVICRLVISHLPESVAGGSFGITLSASNSPAISYYAMLAVMIATLLTVTWLSQSRLGTALRAIRDDVDAAAVMGVSVGLARTKAWVLSALFAALTGGIEASYTNIVDAETAFNLQITTKAIIYATIGGLGTVIGPVIGTLAMVSVDDVIWQRFPVLNVFLLGAVIVALMLFLPRGVLGTLIWRKPRLRRWIF